MHDLARPVVARSFTGHARRAGAPGQAEILPAPNHHADHEGFSGIKGCLSALTMLVGRKADAELAVERTRTGPGDHVVDVGSGPGSTARRAARAGRAGHRGRARQRHARPGPPAVAAGRPGARSSTSRAPPRRSPSTTAPPPSCGRSPRSTIGRTSRRVWPRPTGCWPPAVACSSASAGSSEGATGLASHGWTDAQAASFAAHLTRAGFSGIATEHVPRRSPDGGGHGHTPVRSDRAGAGTRMRSVPYPGATTCRWTYGWFHHGPTLAGR